MDLTTPALLFSAISLLLLAYTNRFLVLAQLIRQLAAQERQEHREFTECQILSLKRRVVLTKMMQAFGVLSFLLCTLSMFSLFISREKLGIILFGVSVLFLAISLVISLWEVMISTDALNMELQGMKLIKKCQPKE